MPGHIADIVTQIGAAAQTTDEPPAAPRFASHFCPRDVGLNRLRMG